MSDVLTGSEIASGDPASIVVSVVLHAGIETSSIQHRTVEKNRNMVIEDMKVGSG